MLENALVKHCAPTLARLKAGNMFVLAGLDGRETAREMRALNRLLAPKGVALTVLRRRRRRPSSRRTAGSRARRDG